MKTMLLIINLHSGKAALKNNILKVVDYFTKNNYMVTLYPTQKKRDATFITIKNIEKYDLIVCCGGDGTFNEVVNGVMQTESHSKIGYIPAGTTNDFAVSLNIPKDFMKAAKIIPNEVVKQLDVGSFNEKYFTYVASFGIFTESSYTTSQELKNIFGHLAYVLKGMKNLTNIEIYHLKVEYDDNLLEDDFIWGAVTNSTSVGGIVKLDENKVKTDDGLFEVILLKAPKNPFEFQSMWSKLLNQEFDEEYVRMFYTDRINFKSQNKIAWCLDGEYGGKYSNAEIIVNKCAIDLIVSDKQV